MPLVTQAATTISSSELARANQALLDLDAARVDVARLTTEKTSLSAEVLRLNGVIAALQAQIPLPVTPVVPVPSNAELTIANGKLCLSTGTPVVMQVLELSYGDSDRTFGADKLCALAKSLGFNAISPLFGDSHGTVERMREIGDAALRAGLIIGFNGDHVSNGRAWLTDPARVALINSYRNAFIRLEIEVDIPASNTNPTNADYVNGCLGLVNAYRAAGGTRVIQVGAYQGGRRLEHVLAAGAQVCAGDPAKKTMLGWQAYWNATGSWYQSCVPGLANGVAGTRAGIDRFSKLGLPACLGVCWRNAENALTDMPTLVDDCLRLGQSFMVWELSKDAITDNNVMVDWDLKTLSPNGAALKSKLLPVQKLYF
jgi:hypothetical protein